MAKRAVNFFWEKRRNPAADIVRTLRELGYTDEQIKTHLLESQTKQEARKVKSDQQFAAGVIAGQADAALIAQPVGTNGHTLSEFQRIKAAYEDASQDFAPTDYQRGYATGFDAWAEAHPRTPTAPTEDI